MMIKNTIFLLLVFLMGVFFWQFAPFYFPQKLNDTIWNFTSSVYKVLHLKDMTQAPQVNSIDDLPTDECANYKELVSIYEVWLDMFGSKPTDYRMYMPFSTNSTEKGEINGIVKWRYEENTPYFGLTALGEWEHVLERAEIEVISRSAETELAQILEEHGFAIHAPMNIPFYRYPNGLGAKKIGVIKNNSAYLIGLIEINKEDFISRFENGDYSYDLKNIKNPLAARVSCSKIDKEEIDRFVKFTSLPHTYSNETVLFNDFEKNGLYRFGLIYPGGSNDYYEHQFVYEKDGKMTKLQTTGEFPLCSIFEAAKVGKDSICYRPELKEFSVVKY